MYLPADHLEVKAPEPCLLLVKGSIPGFKRPGCVTLGKALTWIFATKIFSVLKFLFSESFLGHSNINARNILGRKARVVTLVRLGILFLFNCPHCRGHSKVPEVSRLEEDRARTCGPCLSTFRRVRVPLGTDKPSFL